MVTPPTFEPPSPDHPIVCDEETLLPGRSPLRRLTRLGEPILCLNFMLDGVWEGHAWPVFEDTCRTYVSLYPSDTRCLDIAWEQVAP